MNGQSGEGLSTRLLDGQKKGVLAWDRMCVNSIKDVKISRVAIADKISIARPLDFCGFFFHIVDVVFYREFN